MTVGYVPRLVRFVEEFDVADRGIASLVRGESVVQDPPALVRVVKSQDVGRALSEVHHQPLGIAGDLVEYRYVLVPSLPAKSKSYRCVPGW